MSFTPRPEFIKEPAHTRHNFSLLTLAGSSCIRLYSFPLELISALRRLFGENAVAYREDVVNNFCEFSIDGKPWASPKSIVSERLLVEILAVVYHHGYTCLSPINYGREHDESLALAFSIPGQSDSSPDRLSNQATRRTPFAISFVSATLIRVISPPLHSTPAILQAVRGSWPRGVVSEKKVGHNSYEFRLKGYKWFQEDTFATDSLRHILALLSALDTHSFALSASITLSTRSKVKDLWIFTVPSPAGEETCFPDTPSVLTSSLPDLKRVFRTSDILPSQHRRNATEPAQVVPASPLPEHPRAMSDDVCARPVSLLRKPAPRAQIPISVHDESGEGSNFQSHVPTTTPDIFYATSPFGTVDVDKRAVNQQSPDVDGSDRSKSPSRNDSPAPVPVLVVANGRSSSPPTSSNIHTSTPSTPGELLGPTAFRDSAFSSCTDMSADIPIKWTGVNRESEIRPSLSERESHQPVIPGGWQPTPIQEKPEQLLEIAMDQDKDPDELVQDVVQRVASPEMNRVSSDIRRSEAGIVEMASSEHDEETSKGKGWVLVNVEGKSSSDPAKDTTNPTVTESPKSASPDAPGVEETKNEAHPNATMSPAAKAIVIIDAVEAKKSKSSDSAQSPSKIKRLLSLRKRNSTPADPTAGIGQRFKLLRTPQATRRDGKRRSIDG